MDSFQSHTCTRTCRQAAGDLAAKRDGTLFAVLLCVYCSVFPQDLDVVLLNNDPQYPESGWLPLSMVYNNNTGYVVVTINFQQLANTSISLPDCAHVPLFVKGIGAASNKLEISGIYTLSFFNTLLEVAEVATLAGTCKT